MKCISILQPWASLIVLGHKKIETRSWNTKYSGPLLIHASAGKNPTAKGLAERDLSSYLPKALHKVKRGNNIDLSYTHYHNLPFGKIIGSCNLMDTIETDKLAMNVTIKKDLNNWSFDVNEWAMGDYDDGRFGWLLSDIVKFDEPIEAKGSLGIWNWEPPLHPAIMHASFDGQPNLKQIKALNVMAGHAYDELEKQPLIKRK